MKRSGFTLIELLVVISIIGMLASVILVSLQGAKDKGRMASGIQQSSALFQAYGADAISVWNMDEVSGNTTRNDVTLSMDSLVGSGITRVPGPGGAGDMALHFNGDGSYVAIAATPPLPLFTLSAWVYNETGGDGRHSILQNFWEITGNEVCFWSYSFASLYWRCSDPGTVPDNRWTFIATSWDGSVIRHYIDGKLSWTDTAASSGTSQSFSSIGQGCCGGRQFLGSIDDLRIYSHALGTAEIEKMYALGPAKKSQDVALLEK